MERAAHEAMLHRPIAPRRHDGRHRSFDFVVVDSFLPPVSVYKKLSDILHPNSIERELYPMQIEGIDD